MPDESPSPDGQAPPRRPAATRRLTRLSKFAFTSLVSYLQVIAVTALCHEVFALNVSAAYLIALASAFICNFFWVKVFIFKDRQKQLRQQIALYTIMIVGMRCLEWGTFHVLVPLGLVHYTVLATAIQLVGSLTKFFLLHLVFTDHREED